MSRLLIGSLRTARSLLQSSRIPESGTRSLPHEAAHLVQTLWLFTFSDLKTIVLPSFIFGICATIGAGSFGISDAPDWKQCCARLPLLLLWPWLNLLPFDIFNQLHPDAIAEDKLNKPWRPLPSQQISPKQAKTLMLLLYPTAFITSCFLGGWKQSLALVALGFWYNQARGADVNWAVRNFINGCGYMCFQAGTMEAGLGRTLPATSALVHWLLILAAVVFTTVATQDMYDQAGDSVRGRKTVPLTIGDNLARWAIAVPMVFWTMFILWYWSCPWLVSAAEVTLGFSVAIRTLSLRTVKQDKTTFRLWNLWMAMLYSLPVAVSG